MSKWKMALAYLHRQRLTLLFYGLCMALVLTVAALSGQQVLYAW